MDLVGYHHQTVPSPLVGQSRSQYHWHQWYTREDQIMILVINMSTASYSFPNSYDLYAGYTKMPLSSTPAAVGDIPFVSTTAGELEWVPLSTAIADIVPDTVQIYVSPTGNDTTGTGTLLLPYRTLQRCIESISTTGYNISAEIVVVGDLPVNLASVVDLKPGSLGNQEYPVVISGQEQTVDFSGTVVNCVANATTGLWTLTAGAIFASDDVGKQVVFTSGPWSSYTPNPLSEPTELACFISKFIDASNVELAFSDGSPPAAAVTFDVVTNSSSLILTNPAALNSIQFSYSNLRFDRINLHIDNSALGGQLTMDWKGAEATFSGVQIEVEDGELVFRLSGDLDTTYMGYAAGLDTPVNNAAGLCVLGTGTCTFQSLTYGDMITLESSALISDAVASSLTGSWFIESSRIVGDQTISAVGISSFLLSDLDGILLDGSVVGTSGSLTVSNASIRNCDYGLQVTGGETRLSSSVLNNNVHHILAEDEGALAIVTSGVTFTAGARNIQVLLATNGALVTITGNLSVSTTVLGSDETESPIALLNGSELFSSGSITISASPGRGIYAEGYSKLQCTALTITCSTLRALWLDSGAGLDCTTVTLTTSGAYALLASTANLTCTSLTCTTASDISLYAELSSAITVSGAMTLTTTVSGANLYLRSDSNLSVNGATICNGIDGCLSLQSGSRFLCSTLTTTSTAGTGANLYVSNNSVIDCSGAASVTAAGDYAIQLTYGAVLNCADLTVLGTANSAVRVDNRATLHTFTCDLTSDAIGLDAGQANITMAGNLTATVAGGIGVDLTDGCVLTCYALRVPSAATGCRLRSSSEIKCTSTTITTTGFCYDLNSSQVTNSGASTLTSSGSSIFAGTYAQYRGTGALTGVQTTTSTFTGGGLSIGGACGMTTPATFGITGLGADFAFGSTLTESDVSVTGGSIICRGTATLRRLELINTLATFGTNLVCTLVGGVPTSAIAVTTSSLEVQGNTTATSASNVGLSATNSVIQLGGTLTGSGCSTGLSLTSTATSVQGNTTCNTCTTIGVTIDGGSFSSAGSITTSSGLNGMAVNNANVTLSAFNAGTNTGYGVSLTRSNLTLVGALTVSGTSTIGLAMVGSNLTSGTVNITGCTSRHIDATASEIRVSSTSTLTSAAGVGAVQLYLVTSKYIAGGTINLSRTVVGTTGFDVVSMTSSSLVGTTLTITNSGRSALVATDSDISLTSLNSNTVTSTNTHVSLDSTRCRVTGGTIQGTGGGDGYSAVNGSNLILSGATIGTTGGGGSGISATNSRISVSNCVISSWGGDGIFCASNVQGTLNTVTSGVANTRYGVNMQRTTTITTTGSTVTGGSGDVLVGNGGATITWANVAYGDPDVVTDFSMTAPTPVRLVAIIAG